MAIKKPKRHKPPGTDQIPAELIKVVGRTIDSEIHKLINSQEVTEEGKESIIAFIYKKGYTTDCRITEKHHFGQLHTKFYPTPSCKG
jgi:hypothetical protein